MPQYRGKFDIAAKFSALDRQRGQQRRSNNVAVAGAAWHGSCSFVTDGFPAMDDRAGGWCRQTAGVGDRRCTQAILAAVRSRSRSLIEDTLERLDTGFDIDRTVTVVDASHHRYIDDRHISGRLGEVLYQPSDRGTATGVLLPLAAVAAAASEAIVVITPSDHGVEDIHPYRKGIRRAVAHIDHGSADVVLFAVQPLTPCTDFGWITPASIGPYGIEVETFRPVAGFVEKPDLPTALRLFRSGAAWNTMVVVARARVLLALFQEQLPVHADVMTAAQRFHPADRVRFLEDWYPELSTADFCRDVLTPSARRLCVYTWPPEMGWSDLGSPERLDAWLALQGRPAASRSVAAC